jgi:hypothetical protein
MRRFGFLKAFLLITAIFIRSFGGLIEFFIAHIAFEIHLIMLFIFAKFVIK